MLPTRRWRSLDVGAAKSRTSRACGTWFLPAPGQRDCCRDGDLVLEAQPKHEAVPWLQLRDGASQNASQLPVPGLLLRIPARPRKEIRTHIGCDQIREPAPSVVRLVRSASVAAVPPARLVQAQSPHHKHQPGGELSASVRRIAPQPPVIVAPELLEGVRVAVHGVVMGATQHLARQPATRIEAGSRGYGR